MRRTAAIASVRLNSSAISKSKNRRIDLLSLYSCSVYSINYKEVQYSNRRNFHAFDEQTVPCNACALIPCRLWRIPFVWQANNSIQRLCVDSMPSLADSMRLASKRFHATLTRWGGYKKSPADQAGENVRNKALRLRYWWGRHQDPSP